jgi:hypothetical protein
MRSLPTGRFVRVHSVRKNKNGTVDVVMMGATKKKNPKKRKAKRKTADDYVPHHPGSEARSKIRRNAKKTIKRKRKATKNRKSRRKPC